MGKRKGASRHQIKQQRKTERFQNTQLQGAGANENGDRGAQQSAAISGNPYFDPNYLSRYQKWVRWFYTSWEAQKIITIPVDDAFREPFKLVGLSDEESALVMARYDDLKCNDRLKRAGYQERLLGGAAVFMGVRQAENVNAKEPLKYNEVDEGDLRFVNTISAERISRATYCNDPFSAEYDSPITYWINGAETHISRLLVFDGQPLFSRDSAVLLQGHRYNNAGFGESKLAPLYDALVRVTGTQQGAYQLINLASVLLAKVDNLINLQATSKDEQLQTIMQQISIYRAAIIEGKGVEMQQHSATFGSVPELLETFAQLLAAGSDIPATRFLGQSPGGLNATGDSDLENYYNMVASYQKGHLKRQLIKLFDVLIPSVLGRERWLKLKEKFDIEFAPLWNINKKDQSEVDKNYAEMVGSLFDRGLISLEQAIDELVARGCFETQIKAEAFLRDEEQERRNQNAGALEELEKLAA